MWITNFIVRPFDDMLAPSSGNSIDRKMQVVEVTPFGAQNIGWRFYIVWTCANAAFLPIIYFLYPETGKLDHSKSLLVYANQSIADRTLEDLDTYYRSNPPLVVSTDKTATCRKRPAEYVKMQEADVKKAARYVEQASYTENIKVTTIG